MSDALTAGYIGMDSRTKLIEIITNNLANIQTTGFKGDFGRLMESEKSLSVASNIDMTSGELVPTGNSLDVAISGLGFFAVQTPGGVRYTRNGSFSLNESGDLVTKDGMKVLSSSGSPINVSDSSDVAIQEGGIVTVDGSEVATLKVVTFKNNTDLQREGANRFIWNGSADGVQDVDSPTVRGGALEHSNVNPTMEMIRLMTAYREFESVQKSVRTIDADMNGRLIQELGRLS
jgi:flagellar basal-body rod protein FlgG